VYWFSWLLLVVVGFTIRLVAGPRPFPNIPAGLGLLYAAATWLPLMLINVIESHQMMAYLRAHHHEKWRELTYVPFIGPGGRNNFRTLPWLLSDDDLGDPALAVKKSAIRRLLALVLTVFFTYGSFIPLLGV
jgi:hypothetical protein